MISDQNKILAQKFLQYLSEGNQDGLKNIMAPGIVAIAKGTSRMSATRQFDDILKVAAAIPQISKSGLNPKIVSMISEDDRLAVEWEGNCELKNGQTYNNQYLMLFVIRDGKIHEVREYFCTKLADELLWPMLAGPSA